MTENLVLLRTILDAIPNPVIAVDTDDRVCFANVAAEDFFQSSRSSITRQTLSELMPFASPVFSVVAQARSTAGVVNEYAVSAGTPRMGGERTVDLQVAPAGDDSGIVTLTLHTRSIAFKIDQQLSHRGAARSVSGMASMLAHEIRNPLSGIRGAAQLIEPSLGSEDRALARLIRDETDRIRDLVDQMEVFSDERPLDRRALNIHAVLERVKALSLAGRTGTQLAFREEYDPSLPPVLGNFDQLIQAFINLVKNAMEAIDATGETGEVLLTTAFRPGVRLSVSGSASRISLPLEVCVSDNGAGVAEDIRRYIFDAFVSTKSGGRGLGLALVSKIVTDHGGIVECVARDRGTTFRVLLPLMKGSDGVASDLETKE